MADILDRTVTVTLQAVNASYNAAIAASAKATDAALDSINTSATATTKTVDTLNQSVSSSATGNQATTQSLAALNTALTSTTETTAASAAATKAAATGQQALAAASNATATATKSASAGVDTATGAVKQHAAAAADASAKLQVTSSALTETGKSAASAGESVKSAGEKTSVAGGFFEGMKDKASELVPGLGDIFKMSTSVASGMAALEVAKAVGGWFLDVGVNALKASGQFTAINDAIEKVKTGVEDFVGHAIVMLVSALSDTVGPIFSKLVDWIEEGLKWLRALGDWFQNSGTAGAAFKSVLDLLATTFQPIIEAVKDLWTQIQQAFGEIQKLIQEHPAIWTAALDVIAFALTNFIAQVRLSWALVGALIKGAVELIQGQFKLFSDGISLLVSGASFLWDKLSAGVEALVGVFEKVFATLPGPVQDAFKMVADTVAHWTSSILDFLGSIVSKIPGLKEYQSTFDGISASLKSWGQNVAGGIVAQKAANDLSDAAKQKAADLAKAQQALGVMTKDATDKAVTGALALNDAFDKLKKEAPDNLAALAVAAKNLYADLTKTQADTAATATAQQKAELDTRLKNLQAWAAAHNVVLTDIVAANTATVAEISALWKTFTDYLKQIGFVSKDSVIQAAVDSGSAWSTFFERSQHDAEETAQFIQKTYTDLEAQIQRARDAGYTAQVTQLEQLQAKVADLADKNGVKLKEIQDAFDAITKSIAAIVPASDAAEKAIAAMGDAATDATAQMVKGMDLVTVVTDKDVKDQLDAITNGYQQQISVAGTSNAEKMRITQQYYDALKAEIDANGKYYGDDQQHQVAVAIGSMNEIAKANDQTLEHTKTTTQQATEEQGAAWVTLGKNMQKALRSAASDMADALVNGDKSFSEVVQSMLKSIEKAFIQTFIQTGLQSVTKFIAGALTGENGLLTHLGSLGSMLDGIGKKMSSVFSPGTGSPAVPAIPGGDQAASGALGGLSSALGGIGGAINVVSGAVSAISGVLSYFAMKGQTKVLENIQDILILIYGQLLSVVAPTLQTGLMNIANYELKFFNDWFWKYYSWDGFLGWFTRLYTYEIAIASAVQAGAAQVVAGIAKIAAPAINFDPVTAAIATAAAAVVAALTALGTKQAAATVSISFDSVIAALANTGTTVVAAIQQQTTQLAAILQNLNVPVTVAAPAGDTSAPIDLSPLTGLLTQVRDALTQGSLRPNVQLNVEAGAQPEDVANQIVKQLQLAGIIR